MCKFKFNFFYAEKVPNDEAFEQFCEYLCVEWGTESISMSGTPLHTDRTIENFHHYLFDLVDRSSTKIAFYLERMTKITNTRNIRLTHDEDAEATQSTSVRQQDYRTRMAEKTFQNNGDIEQFLINHPISIRLFRLFSSTLGNIINN